MAKNAKSTQARFAPNSATRSRCVRSLERGLALLVAINRRQLAIVCDLAKDTQLAARQRSTGCSTLYPKPALSASKRNRPLSADPRRALLERRLPRRRMGN